MKIALTALRIFGLMLLLCNPSKGTTHRYYKNLLDRGCIQNNPIKVRLALQNRLSFKDVSKDCLALAVTRPYYPVFKILLEEIQSLGDAKHLFKLLPVNNVVSFGIRDQGLRVMKDYDEIVRKYPTSLNDADNLFMRYKPWNWIEQRILQKKDLTITKELLKIFIRWGLAFDRFDETSLPKNVSYNPSDALTTFYQTCLEEADKDFATELRTAITQSILDGGDPELKSWAGAEAGDLVWEYLIGYFSLGRTVTYT